MLVEALILDREDRRQPGAARSFDSGTSMRCFLEDREGQLIAAVEHRRRLVHLADPGDRDRRRAGRRAGSSETRAGRRGRARPQPRNRWIPSGRSPGSAQMLRAARGEAHLFACVFVRRDSLLQGLQRVRHNDVRRDVDFGLDFDRLAGASCGFAGRPAASPVRRVPLWKGFPIALSVLILDETGRPAAESFITV